METPKIVVNPQLLPQDCPKCGQRGVVVKAGSRRYWVECARYGKNGNCSAIGQQADLRRQAIVNWNTLRA
jgi:hypothetical protein